MLSQRALGRALLERQLLLRRDGRTPRQAIEHLGGMQSQAPNAPYVGLWTRLAAFRAEQLTELMTGRVVVRTHLMRNTVHLVTASDFLAFRALYEPVLAARFASSGFGRNLAGVDLLALRDAGRELLAATPRTRAELGRLLGRRWPGADPTSLAYAITHLEPTVQVPPRGLWGATGQATYTTARAWLGRGPDPDTSPDPLMLRYLSVYGPATVRDVQAWSGLTRLGEVAERLRPRLRTFRSTGGGELFDVPGGPLPDPDTPAPARFLPEYDNLLLSHADRSRIIPGGRRVPLPPGLGGTRGTLLVDGLWQATWKITRTGDCATLIVEPFGRFTAAQETGIIEEGIRLLGFAAAGAGRCDVHLVAPT